MGPKKPNEPASDLHAHSLDYVFGQLSPTEEMEFERNLRQGTAELQEVTESLEALTAFAEQLATDSPYPRRALKAKLMASLHNNTKPHLVKKDIGEWQPSGFPGITMKVLLQDDVRERFTVLARLEPGAEYPTHRHVGAEECYILEGDLHFDGIDLAAGDYIVTDDGTLHRRTWSEQGALLLLNTKLVDEVL